MGMGEDSCNFFLMRLGLYIRPPLRFPFVFVVVGFFSFFLSFLNFKKLFRFKLTAKVASYIFPSLGWHSPLFAEFYGPKFFIINSQSPLVALY